MGIKITEDVVAGARYRYTPQGQTLVRRFHVEGLDPTAFDNVVRGLTVSDSTTGQPLPPYMSSHPTVTNLSVAGYETWAAGNDPSQSKTAIYVDVLYQSPEFFAGQNITQIEISSVDATVGLNWWPNGPQFGKPIVAGVQMKKGQLDTSASFAAQIDAAQLINALGGENNAAANGVYLDYVTVPKLSGGLTMKFCRREDNPPDRTMVKKTNKRQWQGLPAGCWLMRNVLSTQVFAGLGSTTNGWQNTYVFESCTDDDLLAANVIGGGLGGFTRIEFWRDPQTGRPAPGVTFANRNGWVAVDPYGRVDFNVLKLPTVYR